MSSVWWVSWWAICGVGGQTERSGCLCAAVWDFWPFPDALPTLMVYCSAGACLLQSHAHKVISMPKNHRGLPVEPTHTHTWGTPAG